MKQLSHGTHQSHRSSQPIRSQNKTGDFLSDISTLPQCPSFTMCFLKFRWRKSHNTRSGRRILRPTPSLVNAKGAAYVEYVRTWIAEFDSNRYDIWDINGIHRYIHRYLDILDSHTWRLNYTLFFWQEGEMVHDGSTILKRVLMPLLIGFFLRFQTSCK